MAPGNELCEELRQLGYQTKCVSDGEQAVAFTQRHLPALVVTEISLAKLDGFDVCRALRNEKVTAAIPIIVVSARAEEMDRVLALELGADDFVAKPCNVREITLRVRKILARVRANSNVEKACLRFPGLMIDAARHTVLAGAATVELTPTEFRLLEVLARSDGFVWQRGELVSTVSKYIVGLDSRTVDTHVRRLRQKLGAASFCIQTVRGIGYRFKASLLMGTADGGRGGVRVAKSVTRSSQTA